MIWFSAAAALSLATLTACESGTSGSYTRSDVSYGYYSGPGWYDPYYGHRYRHDYVVRPPGYRPGHRPGYGHGPGHRPGYRPGGRPVHLPSRPRPMPRSRR
jgi:hypothetical protein